MSTVTLKKCVNTLLTLGVLLSTSLVAQDVSTQAPSSTPSGLEDCSRELLISYFPKTFVEDTLKKFNVPQDKWAAITSELTLKDKQVIKTVEEKAAKLNPNPLKDPQQRQAAVKLFRETLIELFSTTMKAHGITDEKQIEEMLSDIQQQKAKRFASCMQKLSQTAPSAAN